MGQFATSDPSDEPAVAQVERLNCREAASEAAICKRGCARDNHMRRNVADVLGEANDWLPAQEVARLCGIVSGTPTDEVEPFFAELGSLMKLID